MRRGHRLVLIAAVFTLAFSGCELDILDLFSPVDLETAGRTDEEKAAGDVADARAKDRDAQSKAQDAIREGSTAKLDEAIELRPRDARYRMYKGVLEITQGHRGAGIRTMRQGRTVIENNNPNAPTEETNALVAEALLEAYDLTLTIERNRKPPDPEVIVELEDRFCRNLVGYRNFFGGTARSLNFLAFIGSVGSCGN